MAIAGAKYSWISVELDTLMKEQAERLKQKGFKADTPFVSRMVYRVMKENNIDFTKIVKVVPPRIKPTRIMIKKRKWEDKYVLL